MQTEPYKKAIRKRKVWIEPLFAEGKQWHGMRRFRLRTLKKVNTEALMIAAGQNLNRLRAAGPPRARSEPGRQNVELRLPPPTPACEEHSPRLHWRASRHPCTLFNTQERFWFTCEY